MARALRLTQPSDAALSDLPHRIREARDRLSAHTRSLIEADGAVRGHCASRGLESALTLALLRVGHRSPDIQAGLRAYLADLLDTTGLDEFTRVVVRGVLGRSTPADQRALAEHLAAFDHHTSGRKRLMFGTIAALAGALPSNPRTCLPDFTYPGVHRWVHVQLTAVKVIHACALGHREWITSADIECLLTIRAGSGVWEGYVLAHLLVLHALAALGGYEAILAEGVNRLLQVRRPDGGVPLHAGMEIFCTAVTGLALARAGIDADGLARMARYLLEQQNPDGGWAYAAGVSQSDTDSTAYCLEVLHCAGSHRDQAAILHGERYLVGLLSDDGGFPTYVKGEPSEAAMTAGAVSALDHAPPRYPGVINDGIRFLLSRQAPEGTFERNWSLSESNAIFRAVNALTGPHSGSDPALREPVNRALNRSWSYLHRTQNIDGGWGHQSHSESDPISTAYSLIALARQGDTKALQTGAVYLLGQQRPDGAFTSIPDGAGPRPIPYDVPVLANGYVLLALSAVTAVANRQSDSAA
jgi:squalene-hopene/tetraprenyl-beta-curcumene cyclase